MPQVDCKPINVLVSLVFAWYCAWLSLTASIAASLGAPFGRNKGTPRSWVHGARVAALLAGVAACVLLTLILGMRIIHVGIDLINGAPLRPSTDFGFSSSGLWTLAVVFVSCAVSLIFSGERRLFTCQFWITVMIALWAGLLPPVFQATPFGAIQRSGSTLILLGNLSVLLVMAAFAGLRMGDSSDALASDDRPRAGGWPGFRTSCSALAAVVLLLVSYHLAVPVSLGGGGYRIGFLTVAVSAALAAGSMIALGIRGRMEHLTDLGFMLFSFSLAAAAAAALPQGHRTLAESYPVLFCAQIAGYGLAAGCWIYLACRWRQQVKSGQGTPAKAWLVARTRRCAFLTLAFALLISTMMAVWPRLPSIAVVDDSIQRVAAGLAVNLFLLLVTLWGTRELRGYSFQALCLLSLAATGGFVFVRMLPFTPKYG